MCRNILKSKDDIMNYLLAGRGIITLHNAATLRHLTFKISKLKKESQHPTELPYFVRVLTGADNTSAYTFLGTFWYKENVFKWHHGKELRISKDAISAKTFPWFLRHLQHDNLPAVLEVFHEGVCGKCGRKLTVPESIERGIGPTCAGGIS